MMLGAGIVKSKRDTGVAHALQIKKIPVVRPANSGKEVSVMMAMKLGPGWVNVFAQFRNGFFLYLNGLA